jgi:hypothetical protein
MADAQVTRLSDILRETGRLARLAVDADRDGQTAEASSLYTRACVLLKQCLAATQNNMEDEHSQSSSSSTTSANWESQTRAILWRYEERITLLARALPPSSRVRVLATGMSTVTATTTIPTSK